MGDLVEKPLQVDRRTPLVPLHHRLPHVLDGLMLALATEKTEVRRREISVIQFHQHRVQTLTDDSVHHNRNP